MEEKDTWVPEPKNMFLSLKGWERYSNINEIYTVLSNLEFINPQDINLTLVRETLSIIHYVRDVVKKLNQVESEKVVADYYGAITFSALVILLSLEN